MPLFLLSLGFKRAAFSCSQSLPKLTAYGSLEGNWVKSIKVITGVLLSTGSAREAIGKGQPGDVTDLTGPWRTESRARNSVSYTSLTSYLHPLPASAEQQNKELKQAPLCILCEKDVQCKEGQRMVYQSGSTTPAVLRAGGRVAGKDLGMLFDSS